SRVGESRISTTSVSSMWAPVRLLWSAKIRVTGAPLASPGTNHWARPSALLTRPSQMPARPLSRKSRVLALTWALARATSQRLWGGGGVPARARVVITPKRAPAIRPSVQVFLGDATRLAEGLTGSGERSTRSGSSAAAPAHWGLQKAVAWVLPPHQRQVFMS